MVSGLKLQKKVAVHTSIEWPRGPLPSKGGRIFFTGNGAFLCISRVFKVLQMHIAWSDIKVTALYRHVNPELPLIPDG